MTATTVARPRRTGSGPSVPVYIAAVVVLAAVTAAAALLVPEPDSGPRHLDLLVLTVMFFGTASYVANFAFGRQVHVFQMCDVPRLLGLLFAAPPTLLVARLAGALPALVLVRRQRGRKLLFNMAQFALEVSVAILVFAWLAPDDMMVGPAVWPAAIAATATADVVSSFVVSGVIALSERRPLREVLPGPAKVALWTSLGASVLGIIVATTYAYSTSAAVLLVALVLFSMVASRSYASVVDRNEEAVRLQRLLSHLGPVTARDEELVGVLELVRELFGVEQTHLVRYGAGGIELCSVQAAGESAGTPKDPTPAQWALLQAAAADGTPVHEAAQRRGAALIGRRPLAAVAAPLHGRHGIVGAVLLTERLGEVFTLSRQDVRLLEGVSTQLAQALERGEELASLERAASHDAVTGVPNAQEFRRLVAGLLDRRPAGLVLFVDIARMRSVNDVFGRERGDAVLREVAGRLHRLAGTDGIVGRVGGHHFAVLLADEGAASASAAGRHLRQELQAPFDLAGLTLRIVVHVGVARSPDDGTDPDVLVRRAEAALDDAKQDPFGVAIYAPDMERDAARPLRLVSDLKAVLEGQTGFGTLSLVYQHKVDTLSGVRYGVEALARWSHPFLGDVPPAEFVGLAEDTGLVHALTDWVLACALHDCATWRREGHRTTVAVNLSPISLLDPDLVGQVTHALGAAGLPAEALVLELTETSLMAQPARSIVVLDALREIGVGLSVDDFGTGYSSLAYLRQLPVDEVKLDRSFLEPVQNRQDEKAAALVAQTINLAHALGLKVVVEGVEDAHMYDVVKALGADAVQGWHTGRPVSSARVHSARPALNP